MSVVWLVDTEGQPATLPDPPAVVLLHFDVPYRHAAHVLLEIGGRGMRGRAWRLCQAAARRGVVRIARVWTCANAAEVGEKIRAVRTAGSRGRYCPVCRAGKEETHGSQTE